MKILILEPFYTNFHIELAKTLSSNRLSIIFILVAGIISMYPLAYMAPIYVLLFYSCKKGSRYEN
jgi:hypothetical protein